MARPKSTSKFNPGSARTIVRRLSTPVVCIGCGRRDTTHPSKLCGGCGGGGHASVSAKPPINAEDNILRGASLNNRHRVFPGPGDDE